MRILSVTAVAVLMAAYAWAGEQPTLRIGFDKGKLGELPAGWKSGVTGKADGSVWKIVEDKTAPGGGRALAQTSKSPGPVFNLCILEEGNYKDVDLSVSFKAMAGEQDQGGGLVWRVKDNNNYYVARMNPLEDNFRVYRVVDGKRMELQSANVKAESGKWHTLRVVHKGNKIQCYLNGKMLLEVTDDTFTQAGKVGLWTKADAQTYFADLQITAKKE
jgi:hypothetical protein